MSFEITVHIPALDRLVDAIADGVAAVPADVKPKAKAAPKPKKEPAAASAESTSTEDKPAASTSSAPTADELKAAAIGLSSKNGREALEAALKEHGASAGISTIPDDRKAEFVEHCNAAVA